MTVNHNLTWIELDIFLKKDEENLTKVIRKTRRPNKKGVVEKFLEEYPTPNIWLQNGAEILLPATFEYILVWFIETDSLDIITRKEVIQAIMSAHTPYKISYFERWAFYYDFITEAQYEKIKTNFPSMQMHSKGTIKLLALLFLYKKNIGLITKSQHQDFFGTFEKKYLMPLSYKILYKILYDLELTNESAHKLVSSPNVEELSNHPIYGQAFSDYHSFLIANGTTQKSVNYRLSSLKNFINFLDLKGVKQPSEINEEFLSIYINEKLKSGLQDSSVSSYLSHIQHFLDWSLASYSFLPDSISYPDALLSKLRSNARIRREDTDGLAFTDERFPTLTVAFLNEFKPENELEFLCSRFWMIIASCAARQGYVLNLEYNNCMYPMLNEKDIFGLYSSDTDKGGNKNGHFPILDQLGVSAIKELEGRIKTDIQFFKPIKSNVKSKRVYIHLFQFKNSNQILDHNQIYQFLNNYVVPYIARKANIKDLSSIDFGTHAFRHYLLTHIVVKTGDEETAQAAAGHHDGKMIRRNYIKSKFAKKALLHRAINKYENGEITGKFYLRLIEKLTNATDLNSEIMKDLESEMELESFIQKHGRATEMGYCFDEDHTCNQYMKCWNCPSFMMRREEVSGAINLLRKLINDYIRMRDYSKNFTHENTLVQNNLRAIAMIKERLSDLKYTDEQIETMLYSEHI